MTGKRDRGSILVLVVPILLAFGLIWGEDVSNYVHDLRRPKFHCIQEDAVIQEGGTISGTVNEFCEGDVTYIVDVIVDQRGSARVYPGDVITFPPDQR